MASKKARACPDPWPLKSKCDISVSKHNAAVKSFANNHHASERFKVNTLQRKFESMEDACGEWQDAVDCVQHQQNMSGITGAVVGAVAGYLFGWVSSIFLPIFGFSQLNTFLMTIAGTAVGGVAGLISSNHVEEGSQYSAVETTVDKVEATVAGDVAV